MGKIINPSDLWVYVFYRGEDPEFTGTDAEAAAHFETSLTHIHWLATPTARRRAEAAGEGNTRLYAEKVLAATLEENDE